MPRLIEQNQLHDRVKRLLIAGLPRRVVEQRTGASRTAIDRMAGTLTHEEKARRRLPRLKEEEVAAVAKRCPNCGRKVVMPCIACDADRHRAQDQRARKEALVANG